jgi:hypothetical protein
MIGVDIETNGFDNFINNTLSGAVGKANRGLEKVGNQIQADAYGLVPNDTGKLVESYKYRVTNGELEAGYNIIYASYQERGQRSDGTHKIENRPAGGETGFLRKTLYTNLDKYTKTVTDELI